MLELFPVNRGDQVVDFVKACAHNQSIARDRKSLRFPVCAQMFGSGKTTFGRIVSKIGSIEGLSAYCVSKLGKSASTVVEKLADSLLVRIASTVLS